MMTRKGLAAVFTGALSLLLAAGVLILPAVAQDLEPSWDFTMPDHGADDLGGTIMSVYTEPGHDLLYVWSFAGDIYAIDPSGAVLWRGFMPDNTAWPTLNPDGDLWLVSPGNIRAYSRSGELLIDETVTEQPPQKRTGRAVVTMLSPDYDGICGANIDGDYAWSVYGLGETVFPVKSNINPGMYFLVDAMDFEDVRQEFYALDPWGSIKWSYDATELGNMPVVGMTPVIRRNGSLLLAQSVGTDAVNGEYGEPGVVVSLNVQGEYEWMYPEYVSLTTAHPARDGSVHVATSGCAVRCVNRDGSDRWEMQYDDTDLLLGNYTRPDGGLVMHLWAYIPGTDDLYADYAARIDPAGDVVTESWLPDPLDYYGYGMLFGESFVLTDGEHRLVAFEL